MIQLTEERMLEIVNVDGMQIEHFNWKPPSVQIAAIMQNPWAIQHIYVPSEEMQLLAVRLKPQTIFKIVLPTKKVVDQYNEWVRTKKVVLAQFLETSAYFLG